MQVNKVDNIVTKFRNEKSMNGFRIDILKSLLQKSIRRNESANAIFAAIDLWCFGCAENGKRVVTNLKTRLKVIAIEDTGVANPMIVQYLDEQLKVLEKTNFSDKESFKKSINIVANVAAIMSRGNHLRACSDYKAVFMLDKMVTEKLELRFEDVYSKRPPKSVDFKNHLYEITEKESADFLTLQNDIDNLVKLLLEKNDFAFEYAKKIIDLEKTPKRNNSSKPCYLLMDIFQTIGTHLNDDNLIKDISICRRWLKSGFQNLKEKDLPIYHVLILILKRDLIERIPVVDKFFIEIDESVIVNFESDLKFEVPDYVIDKHTLKGKKRKKNVMDFAIEGALVVNQPLNLFNDVYRKIYVESKKIMMNLPTNKKTTNKKRKKEKAERTNIDVELEFEDISLNDDTLSYIEQLPVGQKKTSKSKKHAYMGQKYVFKGPYLYSNLGDKNRLMMIQRRINWCKLLQIPFFPFWFVKETNNSDHIWVISNQLAIKETDKWDIDEYNGYKVAKRESLGVSTVRDVPTIEWIGNPCLTRQQALDCLVNILNENGDNGSWNQLIIYISKEHLLATESHSHLDINQDDQFKVSNLDNPKIYSGVQIDTEDRRVHFPTENGLNWNEYARNKSENKKTIEAITSGFRKFKPLILEDLNKAMEIVYNCKKVENFLVERAKNFVAAIERL